METLAVLLISLAVVRAAPEPHTKLTPAPYYTSKALNSIGTDAISDVLNFYNAYFQYWDATGIPDIAVDHEDGKSYYHVRASMGRVEGGYTKLASEPAHLAFSQGIVRFGPSPVFRHHTLYMNFSLSIEGMHISYDDVTVDIHIGDKPTSDGANKLKAYAVIEKSRFFLQAEQQHALLLDGLEESCNVVVRALTTEEFVIGNVTITGADPKTDAMLEVLADKLKNQLLDNSYAARVIESIIKNRAPKFFRYCQYMPQGYLTQGPQKPHL